MKQMDVTSVRLNDLCLRVVPLGQGKDRPTSLFVIEHDDATITGMMRYSLRDAIIGSIQVQSVEDGTTEQFTLNFTEFIWTRYEIDSEGKPLGTFMAGWSIARNRPIGAFTD